MAGANLPERPTRRRAAAGAGATATTKPAGGRRTTGRKKRPADPGKAWARTLARTRPGLVDFVLDGLNAHYGRPTWVRWHDPTSELVLTILSQNSADVNAEKAFESLRTAYPRALGAAASQKALGPGARPGWGGHGLEEAEDPDWAVIEAAPLPELIEAIRPGGLAVQKAPRIQAALRAIREASPDGSHSLEFLGDLPAREARDWMTKIGGIGPKTASVLLLFCFGQPLMPVDRHVERVSKRIGLVPGKATPDDAHEIFLAMLEPDHMYEAHVNLIHHGRALCHARRPECARCPVLPRCRYPDPKAP